MRKTIGVLGGVAGCCALLVGFLVFGGDRDQGTASQPTIFPVARIAVIDLEKVLEGMKRRAELEAEIRQEYESKKQSLEEAQKQIQKLRGELELLKSGSEDAGRLEKEIVQKEAELDYNKKRFTSDLEEKRNRHFDGLLERIHEVTQSYAGERGINLVLQRQLRIQPETPPWEAVVHAEHALEITGDIVEILNRP